MKASAGCSQESSSKEDALSHDIVGADVEALHHVFECPTKSSRDEDVHSSGQEAPNSSEDIVAPIRVDLAFTNHESLFKLRHGWERLTTGDW